MKRISFVATALSAALVCSLADAVVTTRPGNTTPNNSTQQTQPVNPFNPMALPGQEFFNNLGNRNDQFLTPDLYNTTPFFPPQGTITPPETRTVPNPIPSTVPTDPNIRTRVTTPVDPRFQPPNQTSGQRKWRLGVYSKDTDTGVLIMDVVRGSAAERAGLETNDRIIAVNGYQVGYVNGQLYDCTSEFERNADTDGWVTVLVQNSRDRQLLNVPVQLESRFSKISGSVALQNRQNLPADAVVNVELQEIIGQNYQPVTIASTQIRNVKSYPIPFSIDYDPAQVSPNGRYAVSANIVSAGREVYRTPQPQLIPSQGFQRPIALNLEQTRPNYANARPVQVSQDAQIAQIVKWFEEYLGRSPTDRELAVWLDAISKGMPLSQVQLELLGHNQFFNRCNQNKQTYITRVHELLIGRQPTRDELDYWLARYDAQNGIRRELAREFQDALGIY